MTDQDLASILELWLATAFADGGKDQREHAPHGKRIAQFRRTKWPSG